MNHLLILYKGNIVYTYEISSTVDWKFPKALTANESHWIVPMNNPPAIYSIFED